MKNIIFSLAAVLGLALAASSGAAFAGDNCNKGNCTGDTFNNTYNQGGAGGNGYGVGIGVGQGGNGYGGAGGQGGAGGRGGDGGSVLGSGNSSNVNANTNQQAQGQQQGQAQGQAQSSRNSNRNDNRSSATGGNSAASNSNSNANSGNNSAQSVNVEGDTYEARRIPVATAYAPNIAPTAVCMGTSSAGAQGVTFGISVGTSWTDDNCMLLEQVRTVAAVIGDKEIAAEMMCDVKAYAAARARAGKPCGSVATASAPAPIVAQAPVSSLHAPKLTASAPIVSAAPIVVAQVPPRIERFRVTTTGLVPLN